MAEVELTSVPGHDARRTARVEFDARVELCAGDEGRSGPRVIVAHAFDLGAGGMGLAARERVAVGTQVTCRLTLDGRAATLAAHVVWQRAYTSPRPHGLGVCFAALSDEQRALLAHAIDRALGDVALSDAAKGRSRRQARYGNAVELASADGHSALPDHAPSAVDELTSTGTRAVHPRRRALAAEARVAPAATSTLERRSRARENRGRVALRALRVAGSLLLAAACGAALTAYVERALSAERRARSTRSAGTAVGAIMARASALPSTQLADTEAEAAAEALPVAAASVAEGRARSPNVTDQAVGSAALHSSPASDRAEPTLAVEDGLTIISIPFAGGLEGMRTAMWADPPAVAIDLPHGAARILRGFYPLKGGIADGLRVRERNGELLVRVLLAQAASRIAVTASGAALEIRLTSAR